MIARERLHGGTWVPPWLRFQHVARYEWAREQCRGLRVLDAACGNGYGSRILQQSAMVTSLDIAPEAIDEARASAGLRLLLGDSTRLPFPAGAFGAFVSFETIEHVGDDDAYLAEARRVVAPGGMFLCSTPNRVLVNPGNTIEDKPFNPFHVREYTAAELRALLSSHFAGVQLLGQTAFGARYTHLLRSVGSRSANAGVRLHQLRKLAFAPFEHRERHEPRPFNGAEEPEVLVAICK